LTRSLGESRPLIKPLTRFVFFVIFVAEKRFSG
jgi:hypothetical protein